MCRAPPSRRGEGIFVLTTVTDNLSQVNQLLEELKAIRGVSSVETGILNDFIFVEEWLDQAVTRQMAT